MILIVFFYILHFISLDIVKFFSSLNADEQGLVRLGRMFCGQQVMSRLFCERLVSDGQLVRDEQLANGEQLEQHARS